MNRKHLGSINRLANMHRDRLPGNGARSVYPTADSGETQRQILERRAKACMGDEEYERRQTAAKEVKHCIMPLPKSNYIVVTDASMIKQMGKKVV
jgi:hypothetical protein